MNWESGSGSSIFVSPLGGKCVMLSTHDHSKAAAAPHQPDEVDLSQV